MNKLYSVLFLFTTGCLGRAGADLDTTWCLPNMSANDRQLIMSAAEEWKTKTQGDVHFSFLVVDNEDQCGDNNRVLNERDAISYSGYTYYGSKPYITIKMVVNNIGPYRRDDNYQAIILHEFGHYLMDPFFGVGHHSSDPRDRMYPEYPSNQGVFHLSAGDIKNFYKANYELISGN